MWSTCIWLAAALAAAGYARGARVLRRRGFHFAGAGRIALFLAALTLFAAAVAWPLHPLSQEHVLARMAQKVFICLMGAPLFWLARPVHVLVTGLPAGVRRSLARLLFRKRGWTPAMQMVTGPAAVWFVYIAAFLLWHDPGFVEWEMADLGRQRLFTLLLIAAALLFWQQVTLGGPRRFATATPGARFAMLIGAEIPNVVAGISIAFGSVSLYGFYDTTALDPAVLVSQQSLSGALTWVYGTLVYIGAIVAVVNGNFHRAGGDRPQPLHDWDAAEKFIAPGLEGRLSEYTPKTGSDR